MERLSISFSEYPDVDSILLAFDDGKLSIVAVHAESNQLVTISLHSFETETLRGGYTKNFPPPIVRVICFLFANNSII